MRNDNKFVLPIIIVLLVIFLPFTILGVSFKIKNAFIGSNPKHLHKFEGSLYYYNGKELVGTYACKSTTCDDAISVIDDKNFNYFEGSEDTLGLFNNEYAIIKDGNDTFIYNLNVGIELLKIKSYKSYGTKIVGNHIIVQNIDGKYGLFNLDNINFTLPTDYDYIGVSKNYINVDFNDLRILVQKDGVWYILDSYTNTISSDFTKSIYDYDEHFIYVMTGFYEIYDYQGNALFDKDQISAYEVSDELIILTLSNGSIKIYNINDRSLLKEVKKDKLDLHYNISTDTIEVFDSEEKLVDTYEISVQE